MLSIPKGNNIARKSFIKNTWKLVGEGAFAEVYKVQWDCFLGPDNPFVAVKKLKGPAEEPETKLSFFDERDKLASLDHPNVVRLIGISPGPKDEIPWLVLEYMPKGDLLSCLWHYAGGMPSHLMIRIAKDVARGMEYLHEQNEIHGDLAARNILLGDNWHAKIADFGRNVYRKAFASDYFKFEQDYGLLDDTEPCPLRWMSPENAPTSSECIAKYSAMGDVWSFGILLFEIWSNGAVPYEGLDEEGVMQVMGICKGTGKFGFNPRYYHKIKAKPYILRLMDQCWIVDPDLRITFEEILNYFEENATRST